MLKNYRHACPTTVIGMCGMLIAAICLLSLATNVKGFPRGRSGRTLHQIGDVEPAPPSIGADVPLTYFGPAPSSVQRELVGPVQLLLSGTVNFEEGTITLPLYKGIAKSKGYKGWKRTSFWYIVTDTSDKFIAQSLGINHSPKLKFADVPMALRQGSLDNQLTLVTEGGVVDFSPVRTVVPGEERPFPPSVATAGSIGIDGYSPLVKLGSDVYNAPILAGDYSAEQLNEFCGGINSTNMEKARSMLHDKVVAICVDEEATAGGGTVTIELTTGFSFGKPILYLSTDAFPEFVGAMEASTFVPMFATIPIGADDSLFSPVERLFATVNGWTNADINRAGREDGPGETSHPLRQGFFSALMGEGDPLNVLGGIPTVATDYSPIWDVNLGEWTQYAVHNHYRVRLVDEFQILGFVQQGFITGPDGAPYGSSGARVNCPIVHRFL